MNLRRPKPRAKDVRDTALVRWRRKRVALALGIWCMLEDLYVDRYVIHSPVRCGDEYLGAAKEHMFAVPSVHEQRTGLERVNVILSQRNRLAREHGLVDDARAAEKEEVARRDNAVFDVVRLVKRGRPANRHEVARDEVCGRDALPLGLRDVLLT